MARFHNKKDVNNEDDDGDNDDDMAELYEQVGAAGSKKNKRKLAGGNNGFKALGLSEAVYNGILKMGFRMPTPVQRKALPVALSGADTVVMARTGSGKTCAFLIPLLEKLIAIKKEDTGISSTDQQNNPVRAVILSPTRELSIQTLRVLNKLASDVPNIRAVGIHGGEGMEKQFNMLASKPDIIVATPGRLAHHLTEIPDFELRQCQMCILDEADRLLEMGFALQIRQIARTMPETSCQKLLFSATMPKVLVEFTKSGFATDPTVVRLDQEATVSSDLRIAFLTCRSTDKDAALLHILHQIRIDQEQHSSQRTGLTLIFAATRHHVEYISTLLTASGIVDTTFIYGSLDQEARKVNLNAFRSGKKPVLVVTDVAARGIDVPLIDHVIHYHFPFTPKLFIHRSGRAARAGRIGFCWSLVEPDELPYMVDLHLFLGRKLCNGIIPDDKTTSSTKGENSTFTKDKEIMYTLDEMTPDMVHYGSVPESVVTAEVENVGRIMNSELSSSLEAESLRALAKVCNNAMKQYRKTRVDPSREGIRRAKAILEGEKLNTGQRLGGGAIPPHPLLIGIERQSGSKSGDKDGLASLDNVLKREEFLRAMSNFRPKETVFEAFATGKNNKDGGASIVSHLDKGRTTSAKTTKNKQDSSVSLIAMKNMRRQMRMARDKGSALVVAGSEAAGNISSNIIAANTGTKEDGVENTADKAELKEDKNDAVERLKGSALVVSHAKRKLSRAERKRLKKNTSSGASNTGNPMVSVGESGDRPTKEKRGSDFRDPSFFIDNDFTSNSEEAHRSRQMEAAMQPSSASAIKGTLGQALRMEEAMLDIVGDEADEMVKKQRMMRWDKSKRKYVQTTVGKELSGDSFSKRMKLESGQTMKSDKMKLGELYEKWQKKTNRSVGRTGVFDEADGAFDPNGSLAVGGKGKKSGKGKGVNKGPKQGDEMKSAADIKKERAKKQNMKIKNMKKADRKALENKQREQKALARKKEMNRSMGKSPKKMRR